MANLRNSVELAYDTASCGRIQRSRNDFGADSVMQCFSPGPQMVVWECSRLVCGLLVVVGVAASPRPAGFPARRTDGACSECALHNITIQAARFRPRPRSPTCQQTPVCHPASPLPLPLPGTGLHALAMPVPLTRPRNRACWPHREIYKTLIASVTLKIRVVYTSTKAHYSDVSAPCTVISQRKWLGRR